MIKHGLIADPSLFSLLMTCKKEEIERVIPQAVQVKCDIVERDPFEKGERALLNLGHTFGHAYEVLSDYDFLHGEAVALGLNTACQLSHNLGLLPEEDYEMIKSLIIRWELPVNHGFTSDDVFNAMSTDKKQIKGKLRFILPVKPGSVKIYDSLTDQDVKRAIVETS